MGDQDPSSHEPSAQPSGNALQRALARRRRALPWSDRAILAVSLVAVVILVPLWLGPSTLTRVVGGNPTPVPTPTSLAATVVPPLGGPAEASPSAEAIVAADAFARTVADGWGTADIGGSYTISGSGTLSVGGGQGNVIVTGSGDGRAVLAGISARDVAVEHSVAADTASGELRDVTILRSSDDGSYLVVVRLDPAGLQVGVERSVAGQTELIGRFVTIVDTSTRSSMPGVRVHAEATGAEPTTIRVRVWPTDLPEPEHLAAQPDRLGRNPATRRGHGPGLAINERRVGRAAFQRPERLGNGGGSTMTAVKQSSSEASGGGRRADRAPARRLYVAGGQQRALRPMTAVGQDWYEYQKGVVVELDTTSATAHTRLEYVSPPEAAEVDSPRILFKSGTLVGDTLYMCTQTEVIVYRVPSFERVSYGCAASAR